MLQIESESRELAEEQELVTESIEQTRPWGNFRLPATDELRGRKLFFYRLTPREAREVPLDVKVRCGFNLVNSDRQHEYWVVDCQQSPGRHALRARRTGLAVVGSVGIATGGNRRTKRTTSSAADRLHPLALIGCVGNWAAIEDETARMIAPQRSLVDGPVFALQGWAPRKQLEALETFARQNTMALISRNPEADEQPPTLLSNPRPIAGAEGAVTFFMTPGYRAWDPTWVVFFSFAAFFAMILADAGYGLVLGIILAVLAKRLGRTAAGRRFRQLAVFMVAVTIGYGLLIGSFFGFAPPAG